MTTLKERWIAALRSGEYKQTDCQLYDGFGFCCLGVLADVNGCLDKETGHTPNGNYGYYGARENIISKDDELYLVHMNDFGETFHDIADYIEANVEVREKR